MAGKATVAICLNGSTVMKLVVTQGGESRLDMGQKKLEEVLKSPLMHGMPWRRSPCTEPAEDAMKTIAIVDLSTGRTQERRRNTLTLDIPHDLDCATGGVLVDTNSVGHYFAAGAALVQLGSDGFRRPPHAKSIAPPWRSMRQQCDAGQARIAEYGPLATLNCGAADGNGTSSLLPSRSASPVLRSPGEHDSPMTG